MCRRNGRTCLRRQEDVNDMNVNRQHPTRRVSRNRTRRVGCCASSGLKLPFSSADLMERKSSLHRYVELPTETVGHIVEKAKKMGERLPTETYALTTTSAWREVVLTKGASGAWASSKEMNETSRGLEIDVDHKGIEKH